MDKRVALACFISSCAFTVVAILAAPTFWWLGSLAGLAAGYLSCEFPEVRESIPLAFKYAKERSRKEREAGKELIEWLRRPHPAVLTFFVILYLTVKGMTALEPNHPLVLAEMVVVYVLMGIFCLLFSTVCTAVFLQIIEWGAQSDWCCWKGEDFYREYHPPAYRDRTLPLTYTIFFYWLILAIKEGVRKVCPFFFWTLWKSIALGIWAAICFVGYFLWRLVILIHSDKRALCAIDGTLGGAISYLLFTPATKSTPEQILIVIFSGFLGAAIGVFNWEIVSKRILHLPIKA